MRVLLKCLPEVGLDIDIETDIFFYLWQGGLRFSTVRKKCFVSNHFLHLSTRAVRRTKSHNVESLYYLLTMQERTTSPRPFVTVPNFSATLLAQLHIHITCGFAVVTMVRLTKLLHCEPPTTHNTAICADTPEASSSSCYRGVRNRTSAALCSSHYITTQEPPCSCYHGDRNRTSAALCSTHYITTQEPPCSCYHGD